MSRTPTLSPSCARFVQASQCLLVCLCPHFFPLGSKLTLPIQGGLASRKPAGPRAGSQPRSVILPLLVESEQLSQKSPAFADAQEVIKPDPLLSDYDEDLDEDESFFEDIIEEEESDEEISDDTLVQDLSETKPIIFNNPAVVEESAHQNT